MAWGSKAQIATSLAVNNTADADTQYPSFVSSAVTLNPGETAQIQIVAAFPATTTNDLGIRVVTTLDDATETWDDIAFMPVASIGRAASTTFERTIIVLGVYKFRVEFRKMGTASETITVDAYVRKDGVSI